MTTEALVTEAIDLLLEANRMFKKQAEERQVIYQKLIDLSNIQDEGHKTLIQRVESDISSATESNYFKKQKIETLNSQMSDIEDKIKLRDELLLEIEIQEANESSRKELENILNEYIQMEEASIYRLVGDYSDIQDQLEEIEKERETFEILGTNDPRIKAIKAIQSHPDGISIVQLSFMLGTTQYHANKIINELLELGLIERNNTLLKLSSSSNLTGRTSLLNLTV